MIFYNFSTKSPRIRGLEHGKQRLNLAWPNLLYNICFVLAQPQPVSLLEPELGTAQPKLVLVFSCFLYGFSNCFSHVFKANVRGTEGFLFVTDSVCCLSWHFSSPVIGQHRSALYLVRIKGALRTPAGLSRISHPQFCPCIGLRRLE